MNGINPVDWGRGARNGQKNGINPVDWLRGALNGQKNGINPVDWLRGVRNGQKNGINPVDSSCGVRNGQKNGINPVDWERGTRNVAKGGTIEIRTGSPAGKLVGTVTVPSGGVLQQWNTLTGEVSAQPGTVDVYVVFNGELLLSRFQFNQ
ncbi:carbohydrate-binding protein [Paenibacillus sp. FSL K6-0276]|uniref:carbohydrate-binding protein n=1 Tax=Paenibacillus sp. FSL K6-0276 TaxID=2921450 RepID=UPI0030EF3CC6